MPDLASDKVHAYGDLVGRVMTAPLGTALPTLAYPQTWPTGWKSVGILSDAGIREALSIQENKIYGWQGSQLVRVLRSQAEESLTFEALERNAVVLGLSFPQANYTTTGGTSEVQTVTITGTPTGGTFTLTFNGQTTSAIAYNATNSAVQTALQALSSIGAGNATVTGGPGPGTPWVVTFASELGKQDVAAMTADGGLLTGGTPAIAVSITTPGVNATNVVKTAPSTARNLRLFGVDLADGTHYVRKVYPKGEAARSGETAYVGTDAARTPFTMSAYPDDAGYTCYTYTADPGWQSGIFT